MVFHSNRKCIYVQIEAFRLQLLRQKEEKSKVLSLLANCQQELAHTVRMCIEFKARDLLPMFFPHVWNPGWYFSRSMWLHKLHTCIIHLVMLHTVIASCAFPMNLSHLIVASRLIFSKHVMLMKSRHWWLHHVHVRAHNYMYIHSILAQSSWDHASFSAFI